MKKLLLLVAATLAIATMSYAQKKSLTKDFTVNGCLQIGSNYVDLLGIKNSDTIALYTEFSVFHSCGVGVAYYAYDDFSKGETGRSRFVDIAYANQWGNFSLYTAAEVGWYDNWADGQWFMEYAICSYSVGTWSFETAPMFMYFPRFDENQFEFMVYGKVTKTFFENWDLSATVWYDNYQGVYCGLGTKIRFPGNFYLGGTLLYKDNVLSPMAAFGWRF